MQPDSDLALPHLPTGLYTHYKGGLYEVHGVARHSETHEALVVYRPLYGEGALWVRPCDVHRGGAGQQGASAPFRWTPEPNSAQDSAQDAADSRA